MPVLETTSLPGHLAAKLLPELMVNREPLVAGGPFGITSHMGAELLLELVNRVPLVRAWV